MRIVISLALAIIGLVTSSGGLALRHTSPAVVDERAEVLYLPNGQFLDALSMGYQNILADVLWFSTINYFGKHYASDKNFRWLYQMCDVVTSLDPRAKHVYHFCSTMLSWEVGRPEMALSILNKAIAAHPRDWFLWYLRGFTKMYFLNDHAGAQRDFAEGARTPRAHPIMARLAARKAAELGEKDAVVSFLRQMIHLARDPRERSLLMDRLREVELGKFDRGARR